LYLFQAIKIEAIQKITFALRNLWEEIQSPKFFDLSSKIPLWGKIVSMRNLWKVIFRQKRLAGWLFFNCTHFLIYRTTFDYYCWLRYYRGIAKGRPGDR